MIVRNKAKEFKYTHNFVGALFAEDLHAKRVYSLANATLGVMTSALVLLSQNCVSTIASPFYRCSRNRRLHPPMLAMTPLDV